MGSRTRNVLIAVAVAVLLGISFVVPDLRGHLDASAPAGEHWSLLVQLLPGLSHNLLAALGGHKTLIAGEAPDRISHVVMGVLVALIALALGWSVRCRMRESPPLVPDRRLTPFAIMEGICEAVYSLMEGVMGEKNARRYFPLIGTLAVFILLSNLLGMIPGFVPPTDTLSTTLALGGVVFVSTHYFGVKEHGLGYLKHFMGPIIKWYALPLMALMFVIELISHLVRPCSLAVRLMGNIMGDHKVLGIFLSFGILLVPLPIMALGLIVALVQTLVFCLLSTVYIALAVEHAEGH